MKWKTPAWPVSSKLGRHLSQHCALLLVSALPSALPEPRTPSGLEAQALCRQFKMKLALSPWGLRLCPCLSSYPGQLKDSLSFFLPVPNVLIILYREDQAPFIPVFWHFNLFATFLSPFPFSLSLSYLACPLPSGLVCSLIRFIFYTLARRTKFPFAISIAFV